MTEDEKLLAAVKAAVKALDDKFGQDIIVLDIGGISTLSDYFIIVTGGNPNQMRAMCEEAELALHKNGVNLLHSEGVNAGGWILLDFGTIVIHLFGKEDRSYYNIERIWGDARSLDVADLLQTQK